MIRTHAIAPCATGVPYNLPRSVLDVSIVIGRTTTPSSGFTIKLSSTVTSVPDPGRSFLIKHNTSCLKDDDLKIVTTKKGLLTKVDVYSDDKTLDVVEAVASTSSGVTSLRSQEPKGAALAEGASGQSLEDLLGPLVGTHQIVVPMPTRVSAPSAPDLGYVLYEGRPFRALEQIGLTVHLTPLAMVASGVAPEDPPLEQGSLPPLPADGVLVATPAPYLAQLDLAIKPSSEPERHAYSQQVVEAPDYSPIVCLPYDRAWFVKTTYESQFSGGVVTNYSANQPSSALALANSPLEILKAAVRVPAELLTLKLKVASGKKDLATKEAELAASIAAAAAGPAPKTDEDRRRELTEQNGLEAAYQVAMVEVAATQVRYNQAEAAGKNAALKLYIMAAAAANKAAIAAGLMPPYDLSDLP